MSKQTSSTISAFKKLQSRFNNKQLLAMLVTILVLTGSASAATIAKVSNNRAKQEQKRVLRTANIEQAVNDTANDKTAKTEVSPTKPAETNPTPTTLVKTVKFVKGGASLQGSIVVVSLTSDSNLNGTCNYSFSLGNSTVNQSNNASGRTCAINIPLSSFVKSGKWRLNVAYYSSNGQVTGKSGEFEVDIMPEVKEIYFTKGGAGQNGSVVSASSNMSETQTGTCTFSFSLNGSVRVTKTTSITNSNQCAIEIPVSEFPKSATYNYTLSFVSSDTLTIANQAVFDVTVE